MQATACCALRGKRGITVMVRQSSQSKNSSVTGSTWKWSPVLWSLCSVTAARLNIMYGFIHWNWTFFFFPSFTLVSSDLQLFRNFSAISLCGIFCGACFSSSEPGMPRKRGRKKLQWNFRGSWEWSAYTHGVSIASAQRKGCQSGGENSWNLSLSLELPFCAN